MAKVFVPQSSCIFGLTIFLLLILSVGLLVFVLRGQLHHENAKASKSGHVKDPSLVTKKSTHTPSPQTASKAVATRSTAGQPDAGHTTESSHLETNPWEHFRLPKYIVPLHYDLLLYPILHQDHFIGSVNITVNVTQSTKFFVVHAYRLTIKESNVFEYEAKRKLNTERSFIYDPHEYFVIEMESLQLPGIYELSYSFNGSLTGSIVGFYKSSYKDTAGQTWNLATSKFQPTYARRAFPCFDEPSFKSTFTVSLVHDEDHIALSNMPVEETRQWSGSTNFITKFQESVPMVTYLACFIVCDFRYSETKTSAGKKFRVYSAPEQENKTQYALQFGRHVLEYFENYFGIDYPLPKQDMVAIPDFVSGAMEHWGVITFRETNLLYDEVNSSPRNKQRISTVISHEMTHMWFGNLVTMEWWDDLWLNEGFASYVEYKGVHEQHPEWDMLSQFVTEDVQPVMDLDSTMNSHPIVQPVTHPDEITEIFDDISYGKGASILRMLEFFVGEDNFRKGISQFLKKHQFKNAKTADLWEELSESCGYQGNHNISSIMKTWTEQMGFPFITVHRSMSPNQSVSVYVAKQERFVKNEVLYRQHLNSSDAKYIWSVPLSYITKNGEKDIVWIHDENELEFTVPGGADEWVKFNINQTGFYLVNYETEEWDRLIEVLKNNHEALSPSDRSNMLFDAFLLGEAGHIPFDVFLSMSSYLKKETHLIPWETAYHSFVYLCQLLEHTEVNFLLKDYVKDLTDGVYKRLGWNSSGNHLDDLLRTTIIGLSCHSGNQDCLTDASELFLNWTRGQEIPTTLRNLVYHYGMAEIGQEEEWNFMWNKYMEETSPSERKTLLYGLAHVRAPYLIQRYLQYAMDDTKIRRQDFFTVLNYIAGNPVGRAYVWNFLRENWTTLVERFTLNDRYLGLAVKKICSYFTSEKELEEMHTFFRKYPDAGAGKRRRHQALENVQNNIKWIKTYKESVKLWLEKEGSAPWYYYRLPSHIIPEHYDLVIQPVFDDDLFKGSVTISVLVEKPTNSFLVHSKYLNVTKVEVVYEDKGNVVKMKDVFKYESNDYLVLKSDRLLEMGNYKLHFEFKGELKVSLKGFYKSSYTDPDSGEIRNLATTQFEATYARRAFPCFDEPKFKTTFSVRIIHDPKYIALSNNVVEEVVKLENGLLETRFEKTVPMVTYLLCFAVCDFKFKETYTQNNVKLRIYAAPHHMDKVDYSLDAASKILTYYEDYFEILYPLKKLDMIAIPDFSANGMENWGLITYSENSLLCGNESSVTEKRTAVSIIAHELAHMWFGDLVTMEWWSDLWLNEGFATYMSQKGIAHVDPEFIKDGVSVRRLCASMSVDKTVLSHPIVKSVKKVTPDIFDGITYSKGASVLGMLEKFMGDDFRKGVSAYLKRYSFSNAKTEDLWEELSRASSEALNITMIMNTWTKQMNYPYVNVKKSLDDNVLQIQQMRFLEDPTSASSAELLNSVHSTDDSSYNYVWQIPLTYKTSESSEIQHLLLNTSNEVALSIPKSEWIKFNVHFSGYYSINYDRNDWGKFAELLQNNHEIFDPEDRANFLHDSFSLASAGYISYEVPLNISLYLKNETSFLAWSIASDNLKKIKKHFKTDRITKDIIKEYIRSLTKNLLRRYGWEDTGTYEERKLRHLLIDVSCSNGNQECLVAAGNTFKQWMTGEELSRENRDLVYTYGLRVLNDEAAWNFVWNRFLNETDPDDKSALRNSLTSVRNTTLLERFMNLAKNQSFIRVHEYYRLLRRISQNLKGFPLVASLLFNNWTELARTYGNYETENLGKFVFSQYDTENNLNKVKSFYRKVKAEKEHAQLRIQTIESILLNIRWNQMHTQTVSKWLQENVYMPWRQIRLPRYIVPSKYDIYLYPNISFSTFEGKEEVEINVTEPTDYILIHESGLKIVNTNVINSETQENITIDETFAYKRNNYWIVRFKQDIPVGQYILKLEFSGRFAEDSHGIARYSYVYAEDYSKRYLVATKFEPTDARKMFPCFDEPDMKAKFKLTVAHHKNYSAVVSNMPIEVTKILNDEIVETTFEESVIMSTYLLSCVVSDFEYIEAEYRDKKIRAYAPPGMLLEASHGLNITVRILEKYEEYFDIPYALPKLDSIAVPNYTVPAMEHWGAITYNANNFLVNDKLATHKRIANVDRVIAHELAHQWFGNLVTMKWWNDLWLNEGISTLIMYMPLKHYYSAIDELDVRKVSKMMCSDSSIDSHPILKNVSNPSDISNLFDTISYEKGGAVLKMLQYTLKDGFRKGLSNYLKKYAYRNAETKDLWEEITNASDMDLNITEMMNTWTLQMGFPYVELNRDAGRITATQRYFLRKVSDDVVDAIAEEGSLSPYKFIWKIPLIYRNLETGEEETLWLNEKNATFVVNASDSDVLKFNPGFVGFYIVKYDDDDWERLVKRLQKAHTDFGVTDRYNLLHDAFMLAESGRLIYDIPMELTKYLKKEKELLPWTILRDNFIHFMRFISGESETIDMLKMYVNDLTTDIYDELIWSANNNSYFQSWDIRAGSCTYTYPDLDFITTIVDLACRSGNKKCLKSLNDELQLWVQGEKTEADLSFVFKLAVPYAGNESLWYTLYDRFMDANATMYDRMEIGTGLVSFTDPKLIQKTIDLIMSDNPIMETELSRALFEGIGENPIALPILWNFTKSNWDNLIFKLHVKSSPTVGISLFCDAFKTTEYLGEFIRFLKTVPQVNEYVVNGCIEDIQKAIRWSEKYEEALQNWLRWNLPE